MYVCELVGQDDAFAAAELDSVATGVDRVAPGLATADDLDLARAPLLALTRYGSELLDTCEPTVDDAVATLREAPIERTGSVAVRAVDVRSSAGVDTQRAERELGQVLVDAGLSVDLDAPDHELRALFADAAGDEESADPATVAPGQDGDGDSDGALCALGWQAFATARDFEDRAPTDRPFFQPGSMAPMEARALANLAGARPGATVLDPTCGTGGLIGEAALLGARVVAGDAQAKMVRGTRENLAHGLDGPGRPHDSRYPEPGDWSVYRGDATRLPLADDAVDVALFDAPYGRQSPIEGDESFVGEALAAVRDVAPACVLVADRDCRTAAADAGWRLEGHFERPVHRSLVRHVHVLVRAHGGEE